MKLLLTGTFPQSREQYDRLRSLGYDITFIQEEREKVKDADQYEVVVCNQLFLFQDIRHFKNLKCIQLTSVGLDRVPLEYINEKGILLYNAKDVYSIPMAEWVVLKILEIYKKSHQFNRLQESHKWEKQRDILELAGKTAVIIGMGSVGREVAKRLRAFQVRVIGVTKAKTDSELLNENATIKQLDEVLKKSDIVVLTVSYSPETRHLIHEDNIKLMKQNSVLVNVSRGGIIDEEALLSAVRTGKFLGVALDVFEKEPLDSENELWNCENVFVTPHNSFISERIQERLSALVYNNLRMFSEKRRDIVLVANYWNFEKENYISRYSSFADLLAGQYRLEVLTSTFCHMTKAQRNGSEIKGKVFPYKIKLLWEPGYKKNISLKRIYSYMQFGRNVLKYLKERPKPDVIIVSVPTPSAANKVTAYANKNHIPVLVDIQDLWPEAFRMALDIPVISSLVFQPMKWQVEQIYKKADKIMAVSDTYVKRGIKNNRKDNRGLCIYLGADSSYIREKIKDIQIEKPENEFWIGYTGSLGHSYDIETVLRALKQVKDSGIENIVFQVMGTGVLEEKFRKTAVELGINCCFKGLTEYGFMMKTLMMCDIAVNPIVKKSAATIINKVADYAAAGLPVINTLESEEYRRLLEEYGAGINVKSENYKEVAQAILELYYNKDLLLEMKQNSLRLFEEKFDRQKSYGRIISLIESMCDSSCEVVGETSKEDGSVEVYEDSDIKS